MKTKRIPILIVLFFLNAAAYGAVIQEPVPVKPGPKAFRDGDAIRIDDVRSTSPHLDPGDTVIVTGRYRLDFKKSASLQLLLTQVEGDGREETDASQVVDAARGWHPFEASITIKHRGFLHLTFYEKESGKPFGGAYFGTESQMKRADRISVAHYLPKN